MNLIYTIILWILILLIYVSGKNNKINKWCTISGVIFSLGVFKEYFLFNLVPILQNLHYNLMTLNTYTEIYSVMTAILYYYAMPTAIIFSMYFYGFNVKNANLFKIFRYAVFIPSIFMLLIYIPIYTRHYQLNSQNFWVTVSTYNIIFGILIIVLMIMGILSEDNIKARSQKLLVSFIIIPPLVYWLITIFVIHSLEIKKYFKLWQKNLFILFFCILIYIFMAFKSGVMGLKLKLENYHWNSDMSIVYKVAEFTSHMQKNQVSKMEWCIENLKNHYKSLNNGNEIPEEFAILSRSIFDMKEYIRKAKMYSGNIYIQEELCNLRDLVQAASSISVKSAGSIDIISNIQDDIYVYCDKLHMCETISNIILNSVEAIQGFGRVCIDGSYDKRKTYYMITVADDGTGMTKENVKNMFMPYFSTKNTERNFGLGITYCLNVIKKHDGFIKVRSELGKGTTVTIALPKRRVSYNKMERSSL